MEATSKAETYHRHGDPDSDQWQEAEAVTGRPNDTPLDGDDVEYAVPNTTLAERAAAKKASAKKVDEEDVQNKAVTTAATKATRKRASKRPG